MLILTASTFNITLKMLWFYNVLDDSIALMSLLSEKTLEFSIT